ncbi:glycosyltransferase family 4 protein [Actinophytocola sp.]|uniref:glycosyltransferase family 4 protein n=1 Tax=Actinophytocola sp. TaxID=1872138 RepID=UPI0025C674E8|nr:glycosyltransferase family 4 protein [Actinophytocola sp.]
MVRTGRPKRCRQTGLVTHTHHLLAGLARAHPDLRLAVTQTGASDVVRERVRTLEGQTVLWQGIRTGFPELLHEDGSKHPDRVRRYYETLIDEPGNPLYRSLAAQYAAAIRHAGTPDLLAQNTNPLVGILKAAEFDLLDDFGPVHVTGVVHDTTDMARRFTYVRRRLADPRRVTITLIAVSDAVRRHLVQHAGMPPDRVRTVRNGIDDHTFDQRVDHAHRTGVFERVRARNGLPTTGRMLLTSARRVAWKGHLDVLHAVRLLISGGHTDFYLAMNGAGLVDSREPDYERHLAKTITELGLAGTVFLLDELSDAGLAACYGHADMAVHPSRLPEPFGYANLEAMLAGAPVIATAHGGPLEYITPDESGLLVPPSDPAALAEAIDRLLTDPTLHARLAAGGQASARRFGLDAMISGYEAAITAHRHGLRP